MINVADGKSIKSPMELAAELSDRKAGEKVRLGYLIRGMWQAETDVLLGEPLRPSQIAEFRMPAKLSDWLQSGPEGLRSPQLRNVRHGHNNRS